MRSNLVYAVVSTFLGASTCIAQPGAAPGAIDLLKISRVVDSAVRTDTGPYHWLSAPIVLGNVTGGPEEDILISHYFEEKGSAYILSDPLSAANIIPTDKGEYDYVIADFNGDGLTDILSSTLRGNRWLTRINWWSTTTPPFDTLNSTLLLGSEDLNTRFACDVNDDGFTDLVGRTEDGSVRLYFGSSLLPSYDSITFADSRSILPFGFNRSEFFACARLDPSLPPRFLVSSFNGGMVDHQQINYRIATLGTPADNELPLSTGRYRVLLDDSIWQPRFLFPDSWPAVADVNGDGVDDLTFNDSQHVYVWFGRVGFYDRMLTVENADLALQGPVAFDPEGLRKMLFPSIRSLGDITGKGIPFFALNYYDYATGYNAPRTYIYASGSFYDEYYDAYIAPSDPNSYVGSLSAIASGPSRALIWLKYEASKDRIELVDSKEAGIPTSKLKVELKHAFSSIKFTQLNGSWLIEANGEFCNIYDAIGRLRATIPLREGVGRFDTFAIPDGMYFASVVGYQLAPLGVWH